VRIRMREAGRGFDRTAAEVFAGRTCELDSPHVRIRTGHTVAGPYNKSWQRFEVISFFRFLLFHCKFSQSHFPSEGALVSSDDI